MAGGSLQSPHEPNAHKEIEKACVFKLKPELKLNSKFILQPILPRAFAESQQLLLALSNEPRSPAVLREPTAQTALQGILLYKCYTLIPTQQNKCQPCHHRQTRHSGNTPTMQHTNSVTFEFCHPQTLGNTG